VNYVSSLISHPVVQFVHSFIHPFLFLCVEILLGAAQISVDAMIAVANEGTSISTVA
jgi:hypothetical protein